MVETLRGPHDHVNAIMTAARSRPGGRAGANLLRRTYVHTLARCGSSGIRARRRRNLHAHGVSFAEAVTVLDDDHALTRQDPDAHGEQRFVTLGLSGTAQLLVVVYTYREPDVIRVISAWKANKRQRELYEEGRS